MKTMDSGCLFYSENLLKRFEGYRGRIGPRCDECTQTECIHNYKHLGKKYFKEDYAFAKIGDVNID